MIYSTFSRICASWPLDLRVSHQFERYSPNYKFPGQIFKLIFQGHHVCFEPPRREQHDGISSFSVASLDKKLFKLNIFGKIWHLTSFDIEDIDPRSCKLYTKEFPANPAQPSTFVFLAPLGAEIEGGNLPPFQGA